MTLKWRGLIAIFECDSCDDEIEAMPGESFDEFTDRRKREGWTASRVGGRGSDVWTHGCKKHGA